MIFRIQKREFDMAGNSWNVGDPKYIEADNFQEIIAALDGNVCGYQSKNKQFVFKMRTPKDKGYGIWEPNPDFKPDTITTDNTSYVQTQLWDIFLISPKIISVKELGTYL
jgi:hypothetical protein